MLTRKRASGPSVVVAWLWAWFLFSTDARPQAPPGSSISSLARSYTNASFSSSPASGSCGKCGIEAPGGIRLVYWEPDSAIKNGSNTNLTQSFAQAYTQVDNGFTYTSPSVYVIYSSLRATATCSDSALHTVGPSFSEKTLAYSSRFLAYGTLSMPDAGCSEFVVVDGFHTIDFSSLYYNPITTTTTYKAGCAPYVNPRLSLPAELTNIDPSWQSCEPLFYGAFDPPSILTKASGGLVPSPVGAGQITNPASAQANQGPLPVAQPVVTPGPPVGAPTNDAQSNNAAPPVNVLPGPPGTVPANPIPSPLGSSVANSPPQDNANSHVAPAPIPAANGNPATGNAEAPPGNPAMAAASPGLSLGNLINSPFKGTADNEAASPASGPNPPAAVANPNGPAPEPGLVAIPVNTGNGKPAYAVVPAAPNPAGGTASPVVPAMLTGAPVGDYEPVVGGQSNSGDNRNSPASGGSNSGASVSVVGSAGITKVTLNDGTTADIPTANIIEPVQPQANDVAAGVPSSNFQSVHLDSGAFVGIPNESGPSSSVMVQGGDYLVPKPTADVSQQTLTLQSGQVLTIPADQPRPVTLQGGQVVSISANSPPQVLTLQNGQLSTISRTTVTLANGQVTTVPVGASAVGSGSGSSNMPQQILTLAGGKVTTVPIELPDQTATLQGGKVTTIPANAPPQVITLANGQISTVSAGPLTTVTLANGKVTALPISTSNSDTTQDSDLDFIDIPDATISGIVHYTHLPIIQIQNATALINSSSNGGGSKSNGSTAATMAAQSGLSLPSSSTFPTATEGSTSAQSTTLLTPLGSVIGASAGPTASKTSSGTRPSPWVATSLHYWGSLAMFLAIRFSWMEIG